MNKWVLGTAMSLSYGSLGHGNSLPHPYFGVWVQECEPLQNRLSKVTKLTVKSTTPLSLAVEDTYFETRDCSGDPLATNAAEAEVENIHPYTITGSSNSQDAHGYGLKLRKLNGTFQAHYSPAVPIEVGGDLFRYRGQLCEPSRVYTTSMGYPNIFLNDHMIGKPLYAVIVSLFASREGNTLQWATDGTTIRGGECDSSDPQKAWNSIQKSWGEKLTNWNPNEFMYTFQEKNQTMAPIELARPGKYCNTFTSLPQRLSPLRFSKVN